MTPVTLLEDVATVIVTLFVGVAGYGTQICMTYALKYSKAAPALAMSYLSVVWGLLGGFFFFHEVSCWQSCCYFATGVCICVHLHQSLSGLLYLGDTQSHHVL